jgi:hypothetical protein
VRVSTLSRRVALLALCGQLAMLAHATLVAHVTCGADGELEHVRLATGAAAPAGKTTSAALADRGGEHDHCLLDEDLEAVCQGGPAASGEPVPATRADHFVRRRLRGASAPAPLYRLAPKNSPPA